LGTNKGLFQLKNNRLQQPDLNLSIPNVNIYTLKKTLDGSLWVGSTVGLWCIKVNN